MKRFIESIALITALLLFLSLGLTACGGGERESAAGTYKGLWYRFVGDDPGRVENDPFSLTLTKDGRGRFMHDKEESAVTWKLSGETFTMTEEYMGISIEYTGTLKDGRLELYNGDPSDPFTTVYTFER